MTSLRLLKRSLFLIALAVLGFAIAVCLPVFSRNRILSLGEPSALLQKSETYSAKEMAWRQKSTANSIDPTPEMIAFFERRTREHIDRVYHNLTILVGLPDYPQEIVDRGRIHDESKFIAPERAPYIWLTEFYRRQRNDEAFTYPDGIEEQVEAAIQHHVTTNRHHPEFHPSPDDMSDVDLIEMVCDWTAIAQEIGENGGSARQWADNNVGDQKRFKFSEEEKQFIYRVIDDLDHQLAVLN